MLVLDHIAVSGETLDEASDAVEEALGVRLQPGGRHEVFGTHNRLLGLEDGLYLEVIAADPQAGHPGRPRWFDLDRLNGKPRLSNWICRTDDLSAALRKLPDAGSPVALSRGDLQWDMAVPASGRLGFDNLHPAIITWRSPKHPAEMLEPSGCRLMRLVVTHPKAVTLEALLAPQFSDSRVEFEEGPDIGLSAMIETPTGRWTLE